MTVRYFAYGSNMDPAQMAGRVPSARAASIGRLRDYRLAFTHRSKYGGAVAVADAVEDVGQEVWGVIYEMTMADLEMRDRHELLYRHHEVDVLVVDADVRAWIYVVKQRDLSSKLLPAEYVSRLRAITPSDG